MAGKAQPGGVPRRRVTWMHIVTFAFATAIAYVLGVVSSLIFPVLGAPGVSGLYVAAAIYVPLGVWMGLWGALAGYISCFFLGLYPSGYSPLQSFVWSWADFIEALVPLLIFKALRAEPDFTVRRPRAARLMVLLITVGSVLLLIGIVVQVLWGRYGAPFTTFYAASVYAGTALSLAGVVSGLLAGRPRPWLALVLSVLIASPLSGLWGSWTLTRFNFPPPLPAGAFWPVFVGWVIGDLIVLYVFSTALFVALTPVFRRTGLLVRGWWA
ncbi:MAG: hypothetical protein JHC13_03345 [Acidilobus sp.]|jgi:hypothetical protein|nr:hypothetical protein [Acidilobus sp.]